MKLTLFALLLARLPVFSSLERVVPHRRVSSTLDSRLRPAFSSVSLLESGSSLLVSEDCLVLCGPPDSTTLCYFKGASPYCLCKGPKYTTKNLTDGSRICVMTDPCQTQPCGGPDVGVCISDSSQNSGYTCQCKEGYRVSHGNYGQHCAQLPTTTSTSRAPPSTFTFPRTHHVPSISPPGGMEDAGPSAGPILPDFCAGTPCGEPAAVLKCSNGSHGPICICREDFELQSVPGNSTAKCVAKVIEPPPIEEAPPKNDANPPDHENKEEEEEEQKKEEEEEVHEEAPDATLVSGSRAVEGEDPSWLIGVVAAVAAILLVVALVAAAICIYTSPKREELKKQMEEEEAAEDAQRRAFLEAAALEAFNSDDEEEGGEESV